MILDAEKFWAAVDRPNGKDLVIMPSCTIDDEFFHLTCHVDPNLIPKIERGEFVDLEKLLPKDPTRRMSPADGRMELVNRDSVTFFMPVCDRENLKINGICRWEQAFRIYAAVYCNANQHRAAEIWQYVYIINLAANSFTWENVACYDYAFRQLMSRHPKCSWSTIFQQMWSLSMRDPVYRNFNNNNNSFTSHGSAGRSNNGRSHRDNYCWKFNKNKCKFGSRCKFEHCCYYCDWYGHGSYNCNKKNVRGREHERRQDKYEENRRNNGDDHDKGGGCK